MHPFLHDSLRLPLEQLVSAHLGRAWRVRHLRDKAAEASHPAAIVSDGVDAVFVKLGEGALARDQFACELAGLHVLTERSGVLTPRGIGTVDVGDATLLVLEALETVERTEARWRAMGRALAQVHRVKGERFGFETHAYWGSLFQDNTPHAAWPDFFRERRLLPRLHAALASGNLPSEVAARVERLSARLPDLCGPPVAPALLHGDAHANNFLLTPAGPALIDPAVYYGHPEMELAYIDFFQPAHPAFFAGYAELAPIDPGFPARRDLWRIPALLAMVEYAVPQSLDALVEALEAVG